MGNGFVFLTQTIIQNIYSEKNESGNREDEAVLRQGRRRWDTSEVEGGESVGGKGTQSTDQAGPEGVLW